VGRNHPAEAMPFDGMVRRYLIIYIVNLLLLTNECQQRSSTDYALGVVSWVNTTLSHNWLAQRPPITRLRNVCHRSGANTIVPSQMAGFGRPMPLARFDPSCCWTKIAHPIPTCNFPFTFTHDSCVMSTICHFTV
jgi:hypothetical protein